MKTAEHGELFRLTLSESISHALKLEQIATRMGDTATQAAAMNYQGYCYRGMGENRRAYNITLKAVRLLEQLPPGRTLAMRMMG
ncbi:MAG: hypothetical protein IPI91_16460 [Flavobacteriales bacterium]|nr:hypothetical protein [Flavobacteriales bacterium]